MQFVVNREVTTDECHWLDHDVHEGTVVTYCGKPTYGCVGPTGTPVTFNADGGYPFFELPTYALTKV